MIRTNTIGSFVIQCDGRGCLSIYRPRPRAFGLISDAAFLRALRLRASLQGWTSMGVFPSPESKEAAGWRDCCPAHNYAHTRRVPAETVRLVLFFTVLASMMVACGQVDQTGLGGAGGAVGADSSAGGAAGRGTGGSAGDVRDAGGSAGQSAAGTAGADGGHDGSAGAAGAAGAMGGASTAPACRGTFVGATPDRLCPQIAGTAQQPGGWQCEVDCSSSAADNASGCTFNGVTYCVSSCSACRP